MWQRTERARKRRAVEKRLFVPGVDGDISVCLIYPNTYAVGMSNLGFQAAYKIFSQNVLCRCDRAFLPDPEDASTDKRPRTPLVSFESERPLCDFELLAFSISFETDYLNVLDILAGAKIPLNSKERGPRQPLVMAGGPATFLNPEPLADFIDLFLIGEGEEMIPEFLDHYAALDRDGPTRPQRLRGLRRVGGAYVPALSIPEYGPSGQLVRLSQTDVESSLSPSPKVARRLVSDLDAYTTGSEMLTSDTVFGDMYLVEASRGCEWGCRFCAAGFMYRPVRYRSADSILEQVKKGLRERSTIGLVGAEMASQPGVAALCDFIGQAGGRASPSSLKADVITEGLAGALGRNNNHSVTVAPEAGSERMRRVINKNLTEPEILRAADLLVGAGVRSLKLYFMVGLPTETMEDVDAIVALTKKIHDRFCGKRPKVGGITLSVNAFVPKPWTPFQWEPMEDLSSLRKKMVRLKKMLGPLSRMTVDTESPREAYLQTLLSRGDRRVGQFLTDVHKLDGDWWKTVQQWRTRSQEEGCVTGSDFYVHRRYESDELLPWDFVDHGVDKNYLWVEWRKARLERETQPCDVTTCHNCAAC